MALHLDPHRAALEETSRRLKLYDQWAPFIEGYTIPEGGKLGDILAALEDGIAIAAQTGRHKFVQQASTILAQYRKEGPYND